MQEREHGALQSAPSRAARVQRDSGLNETQQQLRATLERIWLKRIRALQMMTGCSAIDAMRAIEHADQEGRRR